MNMKSYTVTITEALKLFTVSPTAITWWVNRDYIEAIKVNGKWMLNEESLQEFKKGWDAGFPGVEMTEEQIEIKSRNDKRFDIAIVI